MNNIKTISYLFLGHFWIVWEVHCIDIEDTSIIMIDIYILPGGFKGIAKDWGMEKTLKYMNNIKKCF